MVRLTSSAVFGLLVLAWVMAMACASKYRKIQPENLQFENELLLEGDSSIKIAYRYDVLKSAGNKRYARFEARSDASLLGMRIVNNSADTLHFPENFVIYFDTLQLHPLPLDSVGENLSQLANAEKRKENSPVEYEKTEWFEYIPSVTNFAIRANADVKFAKEMYTYYLMYTDILPFTTVQGLVALPVKKNTPLRIAKRESPPN